MKLLVLLAAVVTFLVSGAHGGGIMGKGLSAGMSRGNKGIGGTNGKKRKSHNDFLEDMKRLDKDGPVFGDSKNKSSDGDEPCIGLCYYKKQLELEQEETQNTSQEPDYLDIGDGEDEVETSTSPSTVTRATAHEWVLQKALMPPLSTSKGCVGLCYHYQKKGDMSTYRKIMKKFWIMPKSKISTGKPCVGICLYYRRLGIPDPYLAKKKKG